MQVRSSSQDIKVYRTSPRRRALLFGIWAIFTLPLFGLGLYSQDPALLATAGIVGGMLLTIFGIAGWWYPRLVLTRDGIAVHQLGMRLETPWDNVLALELLSGQAGIVVREPLKGRGAARLRVYSGTSLGGASLVGPEQQQLISAQRLIPIDPFAYYLKHGDLKQALMRRAPWLADATSQPSPQQQERQSYSRLSVLAWVSLAVMLVAAGIGIAFLQ